jgi:ribosomal protein S17E
MLQTVEAHRIKLATEYLIEMYLAVLHTGYNDNGSGTNQITETDARNIFFSVRIYNETSP